MKGDIMTVWNDNSAEWIKLIKEELIPSRKVTNRAIEKAILQHDFNRICDIGCGEGWLVRRLRELGREANGVDATINLIEYARSQGHAKYAVQTFQQISEGVPLANGPYDAAILNFCIYEHESTFELLREVADQLEGKRLIFIQSLHPLSILKMGMPYQDQWLDDSWKGLDGNFTSTHSWYFRTFSGWINMFNDLSLKIVEVTEPVAPASSEPLSVIFTLTTSQHHE